jgi:hypothetical protein
MVWEISEAAHGNNDIALMVNTLTTQNPLFNFSILLATCLVAPPLQQESPSPFHPS